MKTSPSSPDQEAPAEVPASLQNQSTAPPSAPPLPVIPAPPAPSAPSAPLPVLHAPAPSAPLPVIPAPAPPAPLPVMHAPAPPVPRSPPSPAAAAAAAAERVHRNMRRTTPFRNSTSPYGGRQGYLQMMQQPAVTYGSGIAYYQIMVPVQVINNGVLSYDYMGWNYCWNVAQSWTLTVSPTSPPVGMPNYVPYQHPINPAPFYNQTALPPLSALPVHENSPAAPPPALPVLPVPENSHAALPAPSDQPDQPAP